MTTQIIKSLRSQVYIPPTLEQMEHIFRRMSYFADLKKARREFQAVWEVARKKGWGVKYVAAVRPYILGKYWEAVTGISGSYKGKLWAQEVLKAAGRATEFVTEPLGVSAEARYGVTTPLLGSEQLFGGVIGAARGVSGAKAGAAAASGATKAGAAAASGATKAGASAASRAAAQAGATGAAKGVTNRVMRNRLLKRIAQGTFKFAQSKTGAFTAAVLGGLIALTIAGASYVRRNPSEIALAQLRQRRATRYPRAPSGLVFALHATR